MRKIGLVHQQEEAERLDRGIALRAHQHVPVVLGLRRLVDGRNVLRARVEAREAREGRDLPADLVELELQRVHALDAGLRERRLGRAVEGIPGGLLDAVEVRQACVRPAVAVVRRIGVHRGVGMERELVHDRPRAVAGAVGGAEVADEAHGRAGDVAPRVRVVVAARREPDADHVDGRVGGLERVVRGGEQRLVG